MKLVISTQFCENYAAHDWDGIGECEQRWKNKGGSTYIVENLSPAAINDGIHLEVHRIIELANLEHRDDYSEEYVIDWSIEDNDFVSENERMYEEFSDDYDLTRYWDTRIDSVTGDRTQKFRAYDGKMYFSTNAHRDDGTTVEI